MIATYDLRRLSVFPSGNQFVSLAVCSPKFPDRINLSGHGWFGGQASFAAPAFTGLCVQLRSLHDKRRRMNVEASIWPDGEVLTYNGGRSAL